ncbi:glycosyltransferase [Flavobacterium sp. LT1R49]|uniref:glycosyltransferase n=1 Tax=Flavobacterium arabinosi TaxID=3398737 RepID=UPI003A8B3FCB
MISIIICSRTQIISNYLFENIKNTIGCEYELIVIDNSENQYSIFEAYNMGIEQSIGKHLCFIHDDLLIHTIGWGYIINRIFKENNNLGLIGVAGSKLKTKMPSGYWNCPSEFKEINIIQHLENGKVEKWIYGFKNGTISEVVAIDGVFMVMKKEFNLFFNEKLKGFHNYDLNISFECKKKGFKIFVTNEVLIEHYSNGEINNSWYESTYEVHKIYNRLLPLMTDDVENFNILSLEYFNGKAFLNPFLNTGNIIKPIKIWLKLFRIKPMEVFELKYLKSIIKFYLK